MLENIKRKLDSLDIKYDFEDNEEAEIISFSYEYSETIGLVPCEISFDKDQDLFRFYTEIAEFDEEDRIEGMKFCQLLNYDTIYMKFYMSDENMVCGERYINSEKFSDSELEDILDDMDTIASTLNEYL